jgi:hypothetical protein
MNFHEKNVVVIKGTWFKVLFYFLCDNYFHVGGFMLYGLT